MLLLADTAAGAELTLDQALRIAIAQNHDLKAARAQVDAALGRLKQSGRWPNPRLELSNETDAPFGNEGEYSRSAGFAQEFPIGGRLARAGDVARVDVARALAEVNAAELELTGNVANDFDAIVVLDQKIALHDQLVAIESTLVSASRARYKAGEVSQLDINAAQLELERLRQERTALAGERAAAIRTLAGLLSLAADAPLAIDTALPPVGDLPPLAQLTDKALQRRPDLRLLTLAADRAGAEQALARASAWEDWGVALGVRQDRRVIFGAPAQPADKALMLSLSIPVPLFNDNDGNIAVAAADETTAREQLAALQSRVENEVAGLYEQVGRLRDAVEAYQTETLPLSRRNSELARNAYRNGQISASEVVQAERQERDLGASFADTLAQYLRAQESLNQATVARASLMTQPVDTASTKTEP
ncbi:MAG: TolC family protein [Proteobacteria bacterium]|nr:TolC family protein [Pseudomonadota bacterium]